MWIGYLRTAPAGIVMTTTLLYAMHTLIDTGEDAHSTAPDPPEISFYHAEEESEVQPIKPNPDRVPPPVTPPPLYPPVAETGDSGFSIPRGPKAIYNPDQNVLTAPGPSDGPLVSMLKVAPEYPLSLSSKGIEGFATVQFDVSAEGVVSNIRLVESSHPAFAKPAMRAAERFRYKPRVVDGVAIATHGLQFRFRFDME